eukprot:GHRR01023424.1.p1 GENE.GHRR01023424.1~~GHRR01023424.1.p1  ORF type:complete len:115 (+),score=18.80 GHRR01023424.1:331-675(+)
MLELLPLSICSCKRSVKTELSTCTSPRVAVHALSTHLTTRNQLAACILCCYAGSEDNTVRLWSAATASCLQVIEHPGCVWAVTFTPQGDLVSGCSDAVARVWSTDPSRQVHASI